MKKSAHGSARLDHHPDFSSQYVPPRHIDVWLPDAYGDGSGRFPVIYMHDGQNLFAAAAPIGGEAWEVDTALRRLTAAGEAPPAIVVGIWNTPRRWREYAPARALTAPAARAALTRFVAEQGGPPESDSYLRFLVTELKPFVDSHYRTRPDRSHTLIMGSSMGGLVSLYALCQYPATFAGAGCLSTHWPAANGVVVDYLPTALPRPGRHRIYFDYGTEALDAQYEPYQQRVDEFMRSAGYTAGRDWLTRRFEGAAHNEAAWRRRLHVPLAFLLAPAGVP